MKNMITYFGAVILAITFLDCTDKKSEILDEQLAGIAVFTSANIKVRNESGVDLLNPSLPNSLKDFKVYHLVDSVKVRYFNPLMNAPNAYSVDKYSFEPAYHLRILLNSPVWDPANNGSWTTTYLEFPDGSTDTITAQFNIERGLVQIDRASYNGVPFFDRYLDYSHEPTCEVIKR